MPVDLVTGGETRHESEYRALLHLADEIRDGEIDVVLCTTRPARWPR